MRSELSPTPVSAEMQSSMSNTSKYMIFGSWGVAGVVAIGALVDIFVKFPFGGNMVLDIMFLVGAVMIAYLGYDAFKEGA